MTPTGEYCAFTKAVEHLGDRWSLLIVRELAIHRSLGFNGLAASLPGISRSVLSRRLRKLEELGLIERASSGLGPAAPHRLTPAGEQLLPTLHSLRDWAERWVPEDPAMAERDPTVVVVWLARRIQVDALPRRRVVLEVAMRGRRPETIWLVLERGTAPSICVDDPALAPERYVYVDADVSDLYPISRGLREWSAAIAAGTVSLYGEPALVRAFPRWFEPAASAAPALAS